MDHLTTKLLNWDLERLECSVDLLVVRRAASRLESNFMATVYSGKQPTKSYFEISKGFEKLYTLVRAAVPWYGGSADAGAAGADVGGGGAVRRGNILALLTTS
ncbi:hypothetical protein M0802_003950 [Mischocyttarus mexicanus]|nr:hypothetical protein M0802_003950 [Mischocyttarus mexicanus]